MKVTIYKCDYCGKSEEDYYNTEGWVMIHAHTGDIDFTISHERDKDGVAVTSFWRADKDLHFCSKMCLMNWIKKHDKKK